MTLLVRPRWFDGESWPGYLLRLAEANCLGGIPALAAMLESTAGRLVTQEPSQLLARLGIRDRVPHIGVRQSLARHGGVIMRQANRSLFAAVCPRCLSSDPIPYIRARWELPMEATCHLHEVVLVTRCDRCGRPLRVERRALLHCRCGFPLARCSTKEYPGALAQIHSLLEIERNRGGDLTFRQSTEHEVGALRLMERLAHHVRFGTAAGSSARKPKPRARLTEDDFVLAWREWFQDWPCRFRKRYYDANWGSERGQVQFLTVKSLELVRFPSILAVVRGVHQERPRQIKPRPTRDDFAAKKTVGVAGAMLLTGLGYESVLCAIAAGYLGDVQIKNGTKPGALAIQTSDVLELVALLARTLSVREAAISLGLTSRATCKLVTAEVLPAKRWHNGAIAARIEREDLVQSPIAALEHAEGRVPSEFRESLSAAVVRIAHTHGSDAVKAFVNALCSQDIPIYRKGRSRLLDHSYIDVRDVRGRFGASARGKSISH
jgi:hypothetical protein